MPQDEPTKAANAVEWQQYKPIPRGPDDPDADASQRDRYRMTAVGLLMMGVLMLRGARYVMRPFTYGFGQTCGVDVQCSGGTYAYWSATDRFTGPDAGLVEHLTAALLTTRPPIDRQLDT